MTARIGLSLVVVMLVSGTVTAQPRVSTSGYLHFGSGAGNQLIGLTVVETDEQPVACFGLLKATNDKPQYSYLFIFNRPLGKPSVGTDCSGNASTKPEDFRLDFEGTVRIGKKQLEVAYKFKYDTEKKAPKDEVLKVGGKEVAVKETRVFLVDLRGEKVTYTPVKTDKVDLVPPYKDDGGYERGVLDTIEKLKKDVPEVKKFLE